MRFIGQLAVGLALTTGVLLFLVPMGSGRSCTTTAVAPVTTGAALTTSIECTSSSEALFESNGAWSAIPLTIPALLSLGALARRRGVRTSAAALLTLYCFLTGFSIGMFFLPTAALTIISVRGSAEQPSPPDLTAAPAGN